MGLTRVFVVAVVLVAAAVIPGRATAQPLADRLPADALLYVGWAGAEKLGPAYAQSRLKGVIDASSLPELFSELGPRIVRRLQLEQMLQGDAVAQEVLPALLTLSESIWKKPTALYVGPLDYSGKVPMPKVAILCEAGKDAQALSDTVNKLVARIPADAPFKVRVQVWPGDVLVVANFEMAAKVEETLGGREQFKAALKQGRPDPAFVAFFDAEKVLNVASLAINMAGDAKTTQTWRSVLMTTGVAGMKRLMFTAGFDGKDWGTQAFVEAPQPRMGLLATLLESEPVGDDLLKLAPQSSSWVAASRLDFARILTDVRNAATRIHPTEAKNVEAGFMEVNQALGVDVQRDLLAPLGDQWLAFNSDQTGRGILGLVLVNPLRDAAKVEASLSTLEKRANAALAGAAEQGGPALSIETSKIDGLTVHYFQIPALSPCWAIKNKTLYVALFPQILAGAAEVDPAAGRSILTNEDFLAARKRLGVAGTAISLSYMDLPRLAPRGYQMVLALQRTALGFGDMFGMQTPAMVLPPLNKIMPHLAPSLSATWIDEAGWHYRGVTPFPGAEILGGEQALIATAAPVLAAVAVPGIANARQQAMMMQDMSNLRQIGMGAHMYANEHAGALPPDLGSMLPYVPVPQAFLSPDKARMTPAPPAGGKPEDVAKWVNENSDYVYLGKALGKIVQIQNTAETVLAHEKFETAKVGMINVLYADGHVERTPVQFIRERVEAQGKKAGQ
jgi:prepilin-type processing-associated H-X9-DG protein